MAMCWMFYGWLPPRWALLGGVLMVVRLGLFSYWSTSVLRGSDSAMGGALKFSRAASLDSHIHNAAKSPGSRWSVDGTRNRTTREQPPVRRRPAVHSGLASRCLRKSCPSKKVALLAALLLIVVAVTGFKLL